MCNPIVDVERGYTCLIVACPSLAFAFMLLLISHGIVTGSFLHTLHLAPVLLALSSLHPLTFLMKCFFILVSLVFHCCSSILLCEPHPSAPCCHMKLHVHNDEEMAFMYTEVHVFLALLMHERSYENSVVEKTLCRGIRRCFIQK